MITLQLLKRACVVFPRACYLDESAVRHNRRQWARAITALRSHPGGSKWILDKRVTRQ